MREVYAARRAKLMEGMKAPSIAVIYQEQRRCVLPMKSTNFRLIGIFIIIQELIENI